MTGERDPLERATRALREAPPPSAAELDAGRARMLAAHAKLTKISRVRTLRWVLPLAAVLAAGSALAATPNGFERVADAVSELFAAKVASTPKRVAPKPAPRPPVAERPVAEPVVEEAPTPVVDAAPTPAPVQRPHRARAVKREPTAPEPAHEEPAVAAAEPAPEPAPEPAADRDLATYREAHRVHFRVRDFASALRWWDTYLSEYPRGTFAVEARYNRAICLLRLGRRDEAKQALAPFARGEVARGYRQAEAKKLLEALE